jgi:sortase A
MEGVRTFLRGLGQTLITLGVVVLLFCVYELYFTNVYTNKQQDKLGDQIQQTWSAPAPSPPPGSKLATPDLGKALAIIRMPRIGMTGKVGPHGARVVVEGVGHEDLKKGPGHYPGTALPGAIGNMVISGHRTPYGAPFNRVDELRTGDAIVLETRDMWFTYRVTSEQVVPPTAVEVTYPVPGKKGAVPTKRLLTLTTCNPKYSARTRLIVHAVLDSSMPKSEGDPPALTGGG